MSERCTRIANRHGVKTIVFDNMGDGKFDFINAEQVMEHVTDGVDVMGRLAAGLRPGGMLKISVPAQNRVRVDLSQSIARSTTDATAPESCLSV